MYAALIGFRLLGRLRRAPASVGAAGRPSLGRYIGNAVYTRLPLLMTLAAVILLVVRAGDQSRPIWPLNVPDVLYGSLFFFYGYGLYARRKLIDSLRGIGSSLAALWAIGTLAMFFIHLVLVGAMDGRPPSRGVDGETIGVPLAGRDSILWCVGGLVQPRVSRDLRAVATVIPHVGSLARGLVLLDIHHPPAGCYVPDFLSGPPRQAGPAGIPDRLHLER